MNGREYFEQWAARLHVEGLDPDEVQRLTPLDLKRGPVESKLGGKITRDLTRLSPEEIAERRRESEEFLKQPATHFPAEEDDGD